MNLCWLHEEYVILTYPEWCFETSVVCYIFAQGQLSINLRQTFIIQVNKCSEDKSPFSNQLKIPVYTLSWKCWVGLGNKRYLSRHITKKHFYRFCNGHFYRICKSTKCDGRNCLQGQYVLKFTATPLLTISINACWIVAVSVQSTHSFTLGKTKRKRKKSNCGRSARRIR